MAYDNVKSLTHDLFDWYQMRIMEVGGNQFWFGFTNEYKMTAEPIQSKYKRSEAAWYKRRLARTAMGQPFKEIAPPKNLT